MFVLVSLLSEYSDTIGPINFTELYSSVILVEKIDLVPVLRLIYFSWRCQGHQIGQDHLTYIMTSWRCIR